MEPAYILHRRAYKESSFLLDAFTLNHGRVSLVAKGAHKGKSSRSADLQVFQPLLIDWVGKGSLATLTKTEVPSPQFRLQDERLYAGYYLNELFLRLLAEQDPHPLLFQLYAETISRLASSDPLRPLLRLCEMTLLHEIGQLPQMSEDWKGFPIDSAGSYYLSKDLQFVPSVESRDDASLVSGESLRALCLVLDGALKGGLSPPDDQGLLRLASSPNVRRLLSTILDRALGGRALNSREMLQEYVRLKKTTSAPKKSM